MHLSSLHYAADIDEAMDKLGRNVTVKISNVTIHGHPATGKTSVINLAMDRPPALNHHSTGVAEPPLCSIIVGDGSSKDVEWEELTPGRMSKMVCETMFNAPAEPKPVIIDYVSTEPAVLQHKTEPTPSDPLFPCSFSPSHPSPTPSLLPLSSQSLPPSSPPSSSSSPLPPSRSSPPAGDTLTTKHKRDFLQILTQFLQQPPEISGSPSSFHTKLILMSDSGGQPNYLDVFPLFVRNKCLALFTLKLNERLDDKPQFSYCIQGHSISMADTMLQYTHRQLLESLAKSMSSFLPSLSQSSDCCGNARFAVIGTFADRINECVDESLEDKNTSIKQSLKAYEQLQLHETILSINAITSDKKQRKEFMTELRRRINQSPSVEVVIKLRWFGFYLTLLSKAKQRDILSMVECLDIGRSLDMDEQETKKATAFFHKLNLILHYDSEELVIIKLNPILELVSLLIAVCFINKDNFYEFFKIELPDRERRQFQQQGYLLQETLEEANFQFPELLNAEAFINLLAEVKAVAIIEKSKPRSFFMPCVLNHASKEEESLIMKKPSYPWIVRLKCRGDGFSYYYVPLPPSFSPTLVVLLLSSRDRLFSFKKQKQYRNIFVLHYDYGGDITIIERQRQLEVYYSFKDSECFFIRSFIRKTILETEERLNFDVANIVIEDSFHCYCNPQNEYRHILCKFMSVSQYTAECELPTRETPPKLRQQDMRWLSSGMYSMT